MSRWTHVNGAIRVDAICGNFSKIELIEDIEHCFGKTVKYLDPTEMWDECTVPCGSEGSLQYEFIDNNEENSVNCGTILIHGDLREYWNKEEIINWVKQAISTSEMWWVRSLCIKIDIDGEKSIILIESDHDNFIRLLDNNRLEVISI
jgi:hypothetical protein